MNENPDILFFAQSMRTWFLAHGRHLPWRNAPTAYEVFVSELMLQQTQVATVIPYFERWMNRFPTLESLAAAKIDDVLCLWAGLGFYRRARFLHEGAQFIVHSCGGQFPQNIESLRKIPGVGAYTAGAIASFAFQQNVPAIDGNAERVLARFFGIDGDLTRGKPRETLVLTASQIASCGHACDINQAIMDLGASLCGRIAQCDTCPLATHCFARRNGRAESLPQKKIPLDKSLQWRAALALRAPDDLCLLAKRKSNMLLGGLWEFPMICLLNTKSQPTCDLSRIPHDNPWKIWISSHAHLQVMPKPAKIPAVTHVFSHIRMTVALDQAVIPEPVPFLIPDSEPDYCEFRWIQFDDIPSQLAISSLMKKIYNNYKILKIHI